MQKHFIALRRTWRGAAIAAILPCLYACKESTPTEKDLGPGAGPPSSATGSMNGAGGDNTGTGSTGTGSTGTGGTGSGSTGSGGAGSEMTNSGGAGTAGAMNDTQVNLEGFESAPLVAVALPENVELPHPGTIVDGRAPWTSNAPTVSFQGCDRVARIVASRQRSTLGPGVQLSVGLIGPDGRVLPSAEYAECIAIDAEGTFPSFKEGHPSTNGVTMIVAQAGMTAEENDTIRKAALQFFLSRPAGERVAFYLWGETLQQVSDFTNFFDSFQAALQVGFQPSTATPQNAATMIAAADELSVGIVDDGPAWARSIVVIAPALPAAEIPALGTTSQVVWAVNGTAGPPALTLDTQSEGLAIALGSASALVNEARSEGVVSFGLCTDGVESETIVRAAESGATLAVTLKDALPAEQIASCDPQSVARFEYYDTSLIEMHLTGEGEETHNTLLLQENRTEATGLATKEVIFPGEFSLSSSHGRSPGQAHLRGSSSLRNCDANRLSYSVNLERGRERFLVSEAEGGVGSDKFNVIAMCLDPMYMNQVSANHLMHEMELFGPAYKLVEFKINGQTQGVYLLLENMTDTMKRKHAGLSSVLRRDDPVESKFPDDEEDPEGAALALSLFEDLPDDWPDMAGPERLDVAATQIDLRRFMYYIAFNSLLQNGDWNDEPYFVGLNSLGPGGPQPSFRVYAWDADDVLKGQCDHPTNLVDDPFGLLGCAEYSLELGLFGAELKGTAKDDEAYAFYVDILEQTMNHLSEERVGLAFERTASELKEFAQDPAIVEAMPEWRGEDNVPALIDAAVAERKAAYAERRSEIADNIQSYRDSH